MRPKVRVISSYRCRSMNTGDLFSAPMLYFRDLRGRRIDFLKERLKRINSLCIVGGGGLLLRPRRVNELLRSGGEGSRFVLWGAGINISPDELDATNLHRFELVGLRDDLSQYDWVPCVSCMSPLFDRRREPVHDYVIYEHSEHTIDLKGPRMSNMNGRDLPRALEFLASGETVLTTSYHGAYWATLLGRRVVVKSWAAKLDHFRHPPSYCTNDDWSRAMGKAQQHPDALKECRAANESFHRRVRQLM